MLFGQLSAGLTSACTRRTLSLPEAFGRTTTTGGAVAAALTTM
jgi:hypothetical protein